MLWEAHHSMTCSHEVAVLELGAHRGQLQLQGLEVPFGPQLIFPQALLCLPVHNLEVLARESGKGLHQGLKAPQLWT